MTGLILAITIISGASFIVSFTYSIWEGMENSNDIPPQVMTGVIFCLAVWPYSLTLGIIGTVLTALAAFVNIAMRASNL